MSETTLRQRRAMRCAVARAVVFVAIYAFAAPFAVSAQAKASAPSIDRTHRPIYFAGGERSRPLGQAATIGLLIPMRPAGRSSDINGSYHSYQGLVVEGAVGAEGLGVAAGWGRRLKERKGFAWFGEDVMVTAFRTRKSLDGIEADTTYMGGEVGLTTLLMRVSVGAATRLSGPEWADRTIFTGGVGFSFGR